MTQLSTNNFVNESQNLVPATQNLAPATFERVRKEPNSLWKKFYKNPIFQQTLNATKGVGFALAYAVLILPTTLVLTAINFVALTVLGLCSPALLHPTTTKLWNTAKNKIFGIFTDLMALPKFTVETHLAFKANVSSKEESGNKPLVVFVHGFLHNRSCWGTLTEKLIKETADSEDPLTEKDIYAINLGEPITVEGIDHYARYLATKLEKIRIKRNLEKMDVVLDCHSMGGLVSAHFDTKYASLAGVNVLRIIANGTPWHGTPMAYVGMLAKCGKEMLPDHFFHKNLGDRIKAIRDKLYIIASMGDTIVPYHSARGATLDIPENHKITLNTLEGHLAMLECPQGQELNISLIKEGLGLAVN